jgi:flagellar hook protein FlgE
MSLYGMMRTGVSGMSAQAARLATVADNIANSNTTGYKRASTEFESVVLASSGADYVSGNVETNVRYGISQQGSFKYTTSTTDLAVQGQGFFIVSGASEGAYLTRAGSFVRDGDGNLVNAAGFTLMGYPVEAGGGATVVNGFAGLEPVKLDSLALRAVPSTEGALSVNLPAGADPVAAAELPSANGSASTYSAKSSIVAYDNLGAEVVLDVYLSKLASGDWEMAVFDRATADATSGSFPYGSAALVTSTLSFSSTDGSLTSPSSVTIPVPNGLDLNLDISESSQLATSFTVVKAEIDGSAPSEVERFEISSGGVLSALYSNGSRADLYRIPLANVVSADNLRPVAGNVFTLSDESGDVLVGLAGAGGIGSIVSSALEQSTVDLGAELTTMIEAQRNYQANSKVVQTGAELMEVLVNLQR